VYIFIAIFGSTFYPCRCQLIRFDQYFQGSTGLPEGYVISLFHLIEVSSSFEGTVELNIAIKIYTMYVNIHVLNYRGVTILTSKHTQMYLQLSSNPEYDILCTNIFWFTVSLYISGTFVCYILHQAELLGAQNIYLTPSGITWWSIFNWL
jgi:hypothetical protein